MATITRWYVSQIVFDEDFQHYIPLSAQLIRSIADQYPGEKIGYVNYTAPLSVWAITKILAPEEAHTTIANDKGVLVFNGDSFTTPAATIEKATKDFLTSKNIEIQGTVGDIIESVISMHEPAGSISKTIIK